MNQSDDIKSLKSALLQIDDNLNLDEDEKGENADTVILNYANSHDILDSTVKTQMIAALMYVVERIESTQEKISIYNFITEQSGINMFANGKENLQDN